jgi:hypothetical protein
MDKILFESDSQLLMRAIHLKRRENSKFSFVVTSIMNIMSFSVNFKVIFVRRQMNLVARVHL